MAETFQCAKCAQVFKKGRSDEEAIAERERVFPKGHPDRWIMVCEDCYVLMMRVGYNPELQGVTGV